MLLRVRFPPSPNPRCYQSEEKHIDNRSNEPHAPEIVTPHQTEDVGRSLIWLPEKPKAYWETHR